MDNYYENDDYSTYRSSRNEMQDEGPFFETGNPIVISLAEASSALKSCIHEEVIVKSFLFMVIALLITAFSALTTTPAKIIGIVSTNDYYYYIGAEIVIVLLSNWAIRKNNAFFGGILFIAYSYINGILLSMVFLLYTTASVFVIFVVTAGLFAIMALIGIVTKTDLSKMGNILLMGLIGVIAISLVNMFLLKSNALDFAVSVVGVLIFVGLTAYDTQKIKKMSLYSDGHNVLSLSILGAFNLYLDFINLFMYLLRIFGKKR